MVISFRGDTCHHVEDFSSASGVSIRDSLRIKPRTYLPIYLVICAIIHQGIQYEAF